MFLNQFHTVCPEIETKFLGKLGNSKVFPPKIRWSPTKKRSSPKLRLTFRPKSEFQTFFWPKFKWSPKKKRRSSPKLRLIFQPNSEIQTFGGGCFPMGGGLFSTFHKKSASKAPKTCDFAYFTSQWGGLEPPPPPPPPWLRYWLDPFILFLILKFKFIDCEKTKFKFKFIDFEKSKFKFKFIDFAKVEFKFKFINNS